MFEYSTPTATDDTTTPDPAAFPSVSTGAPAQHLPLRSLNPTNSTCTVACTAPERRSSRRALRPVQAATPRSGHTSQDIARLAASRLACAARFAARGLYTRKPNSYSAVYGTKGTGRQDIRSALGREN